MTDLIKNPYASLEDRADELIPTATKQIYDFIGDYLNRPKDTNVNRASSAPMCVRRRWYQDKAQTRLWRLWKHYKFDVWEPVDGGEGK